MFTSFGGVLGRVHDSRNDIHSGDNNQGNGVIRHEAANLADVTNDRDCFDPIIKEFLLSVVWFLKK